MNKSWMKKINGNWEQMVRLFFEPRFIHDVNSSVFYVFYTKPGYQCLSLRTVKRFMYPWFTPWNDRTVTCDVRQNLVKTVNKKVTILILISFCKNSKQDRSICILLHHIGMTSPFEFWLIDECVLAVIWANLIELLKQNFA